MRSSLWPLCLLLALAVPAAEWSAGDTRLAVDEQIEWGMQKKEVSAAGPELVEGVALCPCFVRVSSVFLNETQASRLIGAEPGTLAEPP